MCLNLETVIRLRPKTPVRNNGGYLVPLSMATAPPTADTHRPCYLEGRSHIHLSFFSPTVQWLDLVPGQRLPVPPHHSADLLCPWKVGLRCPVCAPPLPASRMSPWAWNSQRGSSFVECSFFKFRKLTFPEMEARFFLLPSFRVLFQPRVNQCVSPDLPPVRVKPGAQHFPSQLVT